MEFAYNKMIPHADCMACDYKPLCHNGCSSLREKRCGNPADLDYFCESYKMIYAKVLDPLRKEVAAITGKPAVH